MDGKPAKHITDTHTHTTGVREMGPLVKTGLPHAGPPKPPTQAATRTKDAPCAPVFGCARFRWRSGVQRTEQSGDKACFAAKHAVCGGEIGSKRTCLHSTTFLASSLKMIPPPLVAMLAALRLARDSMGHEVSTACRVWRKSCRKAPIMCTQSGSGPMQPTPQARVRCAGDLTALGQPTTTPLSSTL